MNPENRVQNENIDSSPRKIIKFFWENDKRKCPLSQFHKRIWH